MPSLTGVKVIQPVLSFIIVLVAMCTATFSASSAVALSFRCQVPSQGLQVDVLHGARLSEEAAVLMVADLSQPQSQRTLSIFRQSNKLLSNEESLYIAKVDFAYSEVGTPERVVGNLARLGQVSKVILDVDYVDAEDSADAIFSLELLSGEEVQADAICEVLK